MVIGLLAALMATTRLSLHTHCTVLVSVEHTLNVLFLPVFIRMPRRQSFVESIQQADIIPSSAAG